jgi:hypothetical protein
MRKSLRFAAWILAVGAASYWLAAGANRGWDKNQVQVKTLDEVTGLERISFKKQFVPGIEFLAKTFLGAGLLAGLSFLFPKKSQPQLKSGPDDAH